MDASGVCQASGATAGVHWPAMRRSGLPCRRRVRSRRVCGRLVSRRLLSGGGVGCGLARRRLVPLLGRGGTGARLGIRGALGGDGLKDQQQGQKRYQGARSVDRQARLPGFGGSFTRHNSTLFPFGGASSQGLTDSACIGNQSGYGSSLGYGFRLERCFRCRGWNPLPRLGTLYSAGPYGKPEASAPEVPQNASLTCLRSDFATRGYVDHPIKSGRERAAPRCGLGRTGPRG